MVVERPFHFTLIICSKTVNLMIMIIIMKNSNRRSSHGHRGSKRRERAHHAHLHGSHAFTHTLTPIQYTTTLCEAPAQLITEFGIEFFFRRYLKVLVNSLYASKVSDSCGSLLLNLYDS